MSEHENISDFIIPNSEYVTNWNGNKDIKIYDFQNALDIDDPSKIKKIVKDMDSIIEKSIKGEKLTKNEKAVFNLFKSSMELKMLYDQYNRERLSSITHFEHGHQLLVKAEKAKKNSEPYKNILKLSNDQFKESRYRKKRMGEIEKKASKIQKKLSVYTNTVRNYYEEKY